MQIRTEQGHGTGAAFWCSMALNVHDDEVLGLEAYAAELELLINGTNRGGTRLDPKAALDLQKLLMAIDQSEPAVVKQHQRHVEDCLASLILTGAPPPVSGILRNASTVSCPKFCVSVTFAACRSINAGVAAGCPLHAFYSPYQVRHQPGHA